IDSTKISAHIGEGFLNLAKIDLKRKSYRLKQLILTHSSASYDHGKAKARQGFDASHIALINVRTSLDSLFYEGKKMNIIVRQLSMDDRSGLNISSLSGKLSSNGNQISIPHMILQTPHSFIELSAHTDWNLVQVMPIGNLSASLKANIGKEDVLLCVGQLSDTLKNIYPFRPLMIRACIKGNLKRMHICPSSIQLPGAFSLTTEGEATNLMDSMARTADVKINITTQQTDFLRALKLLPADSTVVIPKDIELLGSLHIKGCRYNAAVKMNENGGHANLNAIIDSRIKDYKAELNIDSIQVHDFLPKNSIYRLSMTANVKGKGFDLTSPRSHSDYQFSLGQVQYDHYSVSNVKMIGNLKNELVTASITSDNRLLKMTSKGEYLLNRAFPEGKIQMDIDHIDLYGLGLVPKNLQHPFKFSFSAEAHKKLFTAHFSGRNTEIQLNAENALYPLINNCTRFTKTLIEQLEKHALDQNVLRKMLPSATLTFSIGKNSPLAYFLHTHNIDYQDMSAKISCNPYKGINGYAIIHTLKIDTLQLDTISLTMKQDTAKMNLHLNVTNGPRNPQITFKAILDAEIRDKEGEVNLKYQNAKGEIGALLGITIRPLTEGHGKGDGLLFTLQPDEPIVAFRKFHFDGNKRWIYLHKNMHVYADVDMKGENGLELGIHSAKEDTVSQQNIFVELERLHLSEVTDMIPYSPDISGFFSAEAHYVQTDKSKQVSIESHIDNLTYEKQRIGNVGFGMTWLPDETGEHHLDAYLTNEGNEVMTANGVLTQTITGPYNIKVNASIIKFPLQIINVFIPNKMALLSGSTNGEIHFTGNTDKPIINGQLLLDSTYVSMPQVGARFGLDKRAVQIKDNLLLFDKFVIFSTKMDPFIINGNINFANIKQPIANLHLKAENYTLLDTKPSKESLLYGKILVDFNSTLRGPIDQLKMRGKMNVLGSTNVTYVLNDSPLTVQNRLGDLVTFTSFDDTLSMKNSERNTSSPGGIDLNMQVNIDPSVRLNADLSADRSSRIELEGGGNLTLNYTPQGDMTLYGRYSMSDGMIKYALPVIPLKEFKISDGSYVDWIGNPMDPKLNLKASEKMKASVPESDDSNTSRMVGFNVSVSIKNQLKNLSLTFDLDAPNDAAMQNELATMDAQERGKQAIALMVTGTYLGSNTKTSTNSNLNMGTALNTVLMGQVNSLVGNMRNANLSFGVENYNNTDVNGKRTNYSFSYSQRFFNNRFQLVLGGKVSTGTNTTNKNESFIDNISLEYRLDETGTRYIRLFYDKKYQSVLEGEITEAGTGLVLRKKLNNLGELFIFKKIKKNTVVPAKRAMPTKDKKE
ncbi:MAG: translocation/assembly module TamB, partial [Bacteroidaceae bacterium]|nr:translocation/assembly module TamB [Bacteroidaceae bacterium]